jgi:hypothetical protein
MGMLSCPLSAPFFGIGGWKPPMRNGDFQPPIEQGTIAD